MNLELEGQSCIVLGGSRGIGRSIALGLAAEGANVAICARGEDALRETERELRKAGVDAYAVMHAQQGIRANAIAPGSTEFPGGIWASVKDHEPEMYEGVRASIPSGRLGTPKEVADVAVFLASPRAQWVTGECVSIDGGQHRGMR